ncbi:hypothetical protein [Spirosoma fluminis]
MEQYLPQRIHEETCLMLLSKLDGMRQEIDANPPINADEMYEHLDLVTGMVQFNLDRIRNDKA